MALHATKTVQLLLENILQQLQPQATHRQCSHSITGSQLQYLWQSGEEQMVSKKAFGHCSWSSSEEIQEFWQLQHFLPGVIKHDCWTHGLLNSLFSQCWTHRSHNDKLMKMSGLNPPVTQSEDSYEFIINQRYKPRLSSHYYHNLGLPKLSNSRMTKLICFIEVSCQYLF